MYVLIISKVEAVEAVEAAEAAEAEECFAQVTLVQSRSRGRQVDA